MNRAEAYKKVGPGWSKLIDHYFEMIDRLPKQYSIMVTSVENRIGMLSMQAACNEHVVQDILNSLTWSTERASAKVCEVCGEKGYRRKALPGSPNRCRKHYIELANEQG